MFFFFAFIELEVALHSTPTIRIKIEDSGLPVLAWCKTWSKCTYVLQYHLM